jgi:hypothetical protein
MCKLCRSLKDERCESDVIITTLFDAAAKVDRLLHVLALELWLSGWLGGSVDWRK